MGYFTPDDERGEDDGEEPFEIGLVIVKHVTAQALLCMKQNLDDIWIPRSVIHDNSEVWRASQSGIMIVKVWWAEKKGLT
jgi:hypothetical protein